MVKDFFTDKGKADTKGSTQYLMTFMKENVGGLRTTGGGRKRTGWMIKDRGGGKRTREDEKDKAEGNGQGRTKRDRGERNRTVR